MFKNNKYAFRFHKLVLNICIPKFKEIRDAFIFTSAGLFSYIEF